MKIFIIMINLLWALSRWNWSVWQWCAGNDTSSSEAAVNEALNNNANNNAANNNAANNNVVNNNVVNNNANNNTEPVPTMTSESLLPKIQLITKLILWFGDLDGRNLLNAVIILELILKDVQWETQTEVWEVNHLILKYK